jgi:hypothetical protein
LKLEEEMSILKQVETKPDTVVSDEVTVETKPDTEVRNEATFVELKKSKKSKKIVKVSKTRPDFPVKVDPKHNTSKKLKFKLKQENTDYEEEDIIELDLQSWF